MQSFRIRKTVQLLPLLIAVLFLAPLHNLQAADPYYDQGKKAYNQGDFKTAENYFQKSYDRAVRKGKDTTYTAKRLYNLAKAQYKLKKYQEARANFLKVQSMDPSYNKNAIEERLKKISEKLGKEDQSWQKGSKPSTVGSKEIQAQVESSISNKKYFDDFSDKLTNEDKNALEQITKEAQSKGFVLFFYAADLNSYSKLKNIANGAERYLNYDNNEILVLLDPNPKGGYLVKNKYISIKKQNELAKKALRAYRKTPPAGRSNYGMAAQEFVIAVLDKSNFKQTTKQVTGTTVAIIVAVIIFLIASSIYAARKLKQKRFKDKLDQGRDLLFSINDKHGDLDQTGEHFINWSSKLDTIDKANNWKNQQNLDNLLTVMHSYLDNPNQSKEDLERPLYTRDLGNIKIEKVRRQDNKEYYCYSTGEPITSPEIYIATIDQEDGSQLRVALSDAVAQQVMKDPKSLHVRSYEHDGRRMPWYEIPNYRYDPYDRSWDALMWYNLGSMHSRPYGYHSDSYYNQGYYIDDNDYRDYETLESTAGMSFADEMSADSADSVAGTSFSDSDNEYSDSAGASFSGYSDNS